MVSPNKIELIPKEMAEIVPLKKYKTANANNAPKRDGMKMIIGVAIFL